MDRTHRYAVTTTWTGDRGSGTSGYRDYDRSHTTTADGRPALLGSSDPAFRGDPARWNPELLLVAALSQCHLLWYLHLCSEAGVVVTGYRDGAAGVMVEDAGGGRFTEVVLRPEVVVADAAVVERARALHAEAGRRCFIASSVAFPVRHEPVVTAGPAPAARPPAVEVPAEFHDLLASRALALVSTLGPGGAPQTTPVWFLFEGGRLRFSLVEGRQKLRNLRRDPRVSIVVVDPAEPTRYVELRGTVDLAPDPDLALERAVAVEYAGEHTDVEPPGTPRVAATVVVERVTAQRGHP